MSTSKLSLRMLFVAVVLPLAVSATAVLLTLSWLPELPESVIVHWDSGGADGFAPAVAYPIMLAALGVLLPVIFGMALAVTARAGRPSAQQKFLAVTSLWTTLFLAGTFTTIAEMQRGGVDVAQLAGPGLTLLVWAGIALVAAAVGWFFLPPADTTQPEPGESVAPVEVAPGERVAWMRTMQAPASFMVIALAAAVLVTTAVVASAAVLVNTTAGMGFWLLSLVPLLVIAVLLPALRIRVRIDSSGLRVGGPLGWPGLRVPLAQITGVTVIEVNPLADFGGWGIRMGLAGRRTGVVLKAGEAIEVGRRNGTSLVVTVDDARGAASVLAAHLTQLA